MSEGRPAGRPTAVVFDLGNVLIDWDPRPAIAAGVGAERTTALFAADDFDFGVWNHQLDSGMGNRGGGGSGRSRLPSLASARRRLPRALPALPARTIDGTVAVLDDLAAGGVDLFALTNWPAQLFGHARERFGFLARFGDIVVSGEEGIAKPDPAIFAVLADRVRRPLAECVFVDDRQDNVDAAAAAGMEPSASPTPTDSGATSSPRPALTSETCRGGRSVPG